MSELEALWLGVVQGLTEFLPVSSSGHLVIFETLLGVEGEGGLLFEVAVHVATLAAIAIFYRRRIGSLVGGALRGRPEAWRYVGKLALGTAPAAIVGLGARAVIESRFSSPGVVGVCMLLSGAILFTTRRTLPRASAEEPSWPAALWIGCAQAVAILPGISRSGTTVAVALALGVRAESAAEFSFLLGIIAIAGAAVLTLPELGGATPDFVVAVALGGAAALVSGVGAISLFVRLLRAQVFHAFSYYAWVVGASFLLYLAARS